MEVLVARQVKGSFLTKLKKQKSLLLAVLPSVVIVLIFNYLPIYGIIAAFQDFDIIDGYFRSPFVGIKHFQLLVNTPEFWGVLGYTLKITVLRIIVGLVVPVTFALLLNELRNQIFKRVIQTISYLPHFLSWVIVAGMIYKFLDSEGPLNNLMKFLFNRESIQYLADPKYFIPIIIVSGLWKEVGYNAIVYIAALAAIDPQLYEAGKIDGAGRWKLTWHVTLPGIVPTMVMLFILSIGGLMAVGFDQVWNMQNSLIQNDTHVLDTYIYTQGIRMANYSFGIAAGLFQGIISLILLITTNHVSQKVSDIGIYKA